MSKTVWRYDRGDLQSPTTTPQGFLRVDGHPARAGIYKYRRDDGSIQYERRSHEEVFNADSLASYDDAPMTIEHPADGEVNADNVRKHEVGHVKGAARQDGDRVATSQVIKDVRAIKLVRAGKQQLSPGYKILLDEKSGHDPRYATPDNPTGRYDADQTMIRVNHLAIVDNARGGSSMRLRMDAAEMVDDERSDAGGGGGNPNHDNNGRFSSGGGGGSHAAAHSAAAHAASAAATTGAGHSHAAQLHEQAAASHRAAGSAAMAQAHTLIAQHHKAAAAEDTSGHTGPGHEHSARAMAATDKAYGSGKGEAHSAANRAAADAHETAAAVHRREGNTDAAAEHQRMADTHKSTIGTDLRIRPGMMTSPGTSPPAPPPKRYEAPKASADAKVASAAAYGSEAKVKGDNAATAPLSAFREVAKLHDAAAAAHGQGWEADHHRATANHYREIAEGKRDRPVYSKHRGDSVDMAQRADDSSELANTSGRAIDHRRASVAHADAAVLLARVDHTRSRSHADRAAAHGSQADRALDQSRHDSSIRLTTATDGHQHSIDLDPPWGSRMGGCTSHSVSSDEKAEHGHAHDWVRNADGSITIGMSEGHTHDLLEDSALVGYPSLESMAAAADSAAAYGIRPT